MTFQRSLLFFILLLGITSACKKGFELENEAPETQLALNSIKLDGPDRLTSLVSLQWFGFDRDGFVTGFEYSTDQISWKFTTTQDTTFRFRTTGGDTSDITFYIRSIDNDGNKDLSPAFLKIPIRNSPPTVAFDDTYFRPDTLQLVACFQWIANDPDGEETIDSLFIKINQGPWTAINRRANMVRIVPDNLTGQGNMSATLFSGVAAFPDFRITSPRTEPNTLPGLNLNGTNVLYVKVKDQSGAESNTDTTKLFYLRKASSNLLLAHAHNDAQADQIYQSTFSSAGQTYDVVQVANYQAATQIRFWQYDFDILISQYQKLFWYSSGSNSFYLEVTAPLFENYLSKGKKLMMSTQLTGRLSNSSRLFFYTPMDSIRNSTQQTSADVYPGFRAFPSNTAEFDTLLYNAGGFVDAAPFFVKPSAQAIYRAELDVFGNWNPPRTIGAKAFFGNGQTNMVFFSVDLYGYNGNPQALRQLFNRVMNNEFNW